MYHLLLLILALVTVAHVHGQHVGATRQKRLAVQVPSSTDE